jgi:hypothetical protein
MTREMGNKKAASHGEKRKRTDANEAKTADPAWNKSNLPSNALLAFNG